MTKMAAMSIYGKTLKNLQNRKSYDLETLYVATGTRFHSMIFCSNKDLGLTLTYFMASSNFVN